MSDADPKLETMCLRFIELKIKEIQIQKEIDEVKDQLLNCTRWKKRINLPNGMWVRHGMWYGVEYNSQNVFSHLHSDQRVITLDYNAIAKAARSGELPDSVKNLVRKKSKHFIQFGGL